MCGKAWRIACRSYQCWPPLANHSVKLTRILMDCCNSGLVSSGATGQKLVEFLPDVDGS